LARLTAKGNAIWSSARASENQQQRIYLDGERFGQPDDPTATTRLDYALTGLPRRASDFELWFWIARQMGIGLIPNRNVFKSDAIIEVINLGIDRSRLQAPIREVLTKPGVQRLIGEGEYEFIPTDATDAEIQAAFDALTGDQPLLENIEVHIENFLDPVVAELAVKPNLFPMRFTKAPVGFGDPDNPIPAETISVITAPWGDNFQNVQPMILGTRLTADLLREISPQTGFDGTFIRF
jgi:hypothetical protein